MKSLYDSALARVKRIEDSLNRQPIYGYPGQKYFYVFGFTKGGKTVSLGPFMNEQDANNELAKFVDGEVFEYKTRDLSKATRQMKAELEKRGEDPDEALRRHLHSKGLEREHKYGR